MLSGNKGEWSEVYVLLKLLADKKLFAGDKELKKVENLFYPIIHIIRNERDTNLNFSYDGDLVLINSEDESTRISISEFQQKSQILLDTITSQKTRSFQVPQIESFLNSCGSNSLKASSSVKSDITIRLHDYRTGQSPELGFSIKSELGGLPTLLNASKTTNLIFQIEGINDIQKTIKDVKEIDSKSKLRQRISLIKKEGGSFTFSGFEKNTFRNNLTLIDSRLPEIISQMVLNYFSTGQNQIKLLVDELTFSNPLNYDLSTGQPYYEYKVKRFLTDIALGMMPSKSWTGTLDATGGYIVVKKDGDVICYHIYNRNHFEDFLFYNTKLDTHSTSRQGFGELYQEDNKLYFKLNLMIRFIK